MAEENGIVALWCFWKKHRPDVKEYHLTADHDGAAALCALLQNILSTRSERTQPFALTNDSRYAKRAGNAHKAMMFQTVYFKLNAAVQEPLFTFTESEDHSTLTLQFSAAYGEKLIEACRDLLIDYGGYAIGEEDELPAVLRIWWF